MPTMSTKREVVAEGEELCCGPCWQTLPDNILLHVFSHLNASSLYQVGLVCKTWLRVAFDEYLWKDLFYRHWQVNRSIPMAPGKYSWVQEYKRLLFHTPSEESEVLKQHADQVLHVSFSHNGKMFATCSKDGFIRVWDATYPTSLKYKGDMRKFTWKYTQFSQFNSTDTLLLVSGVHFGSRRMSGEIAVFSLEGEFTMQCRVMNKPYAVLGTWYNDCYLLSGNLYRTAHLNSCSAISLNKAFQETNSVEESVVMRLFKFANINGGCIGTIMVADCLSEGDETALPGGSTGEYLDETADLIGQEPTNQVEDTIEVEIPCNPSGEEEESEQYEVKTIKEMIRPAKHLQSVQVYENGSFVTKFLELDDDEPSSRLNGAIHYSNYYRMEEGAMADGFQCETSGSDLSSDKSMPAISSGSDLSDKGSNEDGIDLVQDMRDLEQAKISVEDEEGHVEDNVCFDLELNSTANLESALAKCTENGVRSDCSKSGKNQNREQRKDADDPDENIEIQSTSDINVECLPVKAKCYASVTDSPRIKLGNNQRGDAFDALPLPSYQPKSRKLKRSQSKTNLDKYLLFTKGSETYTPHQIGIKRIRPLKSLNDDGTCLLPKVTENLGHANGDQQGDEYDEVDHLIDMHGCIIGMALSPDQRYLYVNSRPWPKHYHIENPSYLPPIAQEIDIHVIDLLKMREVGTMHRSHKAYTPNDECFFIFLDVCDEYVASGAEDKHGYLWDRHYGLCLHKYPHSDVVNSVAFNPSDPEVLVTVSDDFSIKIWRSRSREREVVKAFNKERCIRLKHVQSIMDGTDEKQEATADSDQIGFYGKEAIN